VIWSGFQIQPQKSSPQQEGAMSWNAVLYGPV
jgi:hypothetical protein